MIEYKQLYLHKPQEGSWGDCFRACIASILDFEHVADVPHVYDKGASAEEATEHLNKLLARGNLVYVEIPLAATADQLRVYLKRYYKNIHVIIGCSSKHGNHSVVMKNDDYMWDPSIDNSGCVGPMDDGYYWIGNILLKV